MHIVVSVNEATRMLLFLTAGDWINTKIANQYSC